ncbi:superoxide dismutase, Cu-Zn family [Fistulifera solaris]|uniref:Superoxide dismutase, Cu-Zn family n=1 Tax=Fistulifera solaris TaxID=1519565 RepID=A0A1Z5KCB1_FISSO|nr:superoxide dismutase, Cu-Zn family [Fistulifera solaris]|eukprot:GAX23877.1 superoxide dismutase, Cu-Zn family [Fistulifera solaris]
MATCKAICVVYSNNSIVGTLTLTSSEGSTSIHGTLSGLTPGKHGLSICVAGDLSQGGNSCGPIFNPFGKTHGAPTDENRMAGDLGNVEIGENGSGVVNIPDNALVQLLGPHSVIGRSIVVYAGEDDLGRGGHENSGTTGNAGPRIAAGVIGLVV